MNNVIDKKFYDLIDEIKSKDEQSIFDYMVEKFCAIPVQTQKNIEIFFNQFPYWGELNLEEKNYGFLKDKAKVFKNNLNDYVWLYENLKDYRSKALLYAITNNYYNFDFENLKKTTEYAFSHYFDLNLIPKCENEVFVDVGAYTGDSTLDFINSYGTNCYTKIYCYEITNNNCALMQNSFLNFENIEIRNKAVFNKNCKLCFNENSVSSSANRAVEGKDSNVLAVCLDDDINEKITMVKMDIEGGEKQALEGMKNHIKTNCPKLLISVYHNNVDLFEIPKQIISYNKNYNLFLRYFGGCVFPTEIVLLAIPK